MRKKFSMTSGVAAALIASASLGVAPAQAAVKVGVLTCNVQSGWGYILGSSKTSLTRTERSLCRR